VSQPLVSVLIPVFNAVGYLDECLASVITQTIGFEQLEVVAVDDGSTDGSGELLDRWAALHRNVRVVHQPNSGAPGGPRNRAIEIATGEFLFFADPDDYLGPEALERMMAAARRDDADIVLGRIKGIGRAAATGPFAHNVERGDIHSSNAVWSLTAHKLFRRSLVTDHGLRFAEGVRLAEEQVFIVPAYFLAKAISVVADYDCYYLVHRDDRQHLTRQVPDPGPFYGVVRSALETVVANTEPGPARDSLLRRWAEVEILNKFRGQYPGWPHDRQHGYARLAASILTDFIPDEVIAARPPLDRLRARLVRHGRVDDVVELARFEYLAPGGGVELALPPGGQRVSVDVRTGLLLPDDATMRAWVVLRSEADGTELAQPSGTLGHGGRVAARSARAGADTDAVVGTTIPGGEPLAFRAVFDLPALGAAGRRPGRWRFLLRLTLAGDEPGDHIQHVPLRLPGRKVPAAAAARRLRICRGRVLLVWVACDRNGEAVLEVAGWRAILGAARRRIRRAAPAGHGADGRWGGMQAAVANRGVRGRRVTGHSALLYPHGR
jgi:glycosyltransferase involved in cell wall biosynthesis